MERESNADTVEMPHCDRREVIIYSITLVRKQLMVDDSNGCKVTGNNNLFPV